MMLCCDKYSSVSWYREKYKPSKSSRYRKKPEQNQATEPLKEYYQDWEKISSQNKNTQYSDSDLVLKLGITRVGVLQVFLLLPSPGSLN